MVSDLSYTDAAMNAAASAAASRDVDDEDTENPPVNPAPPDKSDNPPRRVGKITPRDAYNFGRKAYEKYASQLRHGLLVKPPTSGFKALRFATAWEEGYNSAKAMSEAVEAAAAPDAGNAQATTSESTPEVFNRQDYLNTNPAAAAGFPSRRVAFECGVWLYRCNLPVTTPLFRSGRNEYVARGYAWAVKHPRTPINFDTRTIAKMERRSLDLNLVVAKQPASIPDKSLYRFTSRAYIDGIATCDSDEPLSTLSDTKYHTLSEHVEWVAGWFDRYYGLVHYEPSLTIHPAPTPPVKTTMPDAPAPATEPSDAGLYTIMMDNRFTEFAPRNLTPRERDLVSEVLKAVDLVSLDPQRPRLRIVQVVPKVVTTYEIVK